MLKARLWMAACAAPVTIAAALCVTPVSIASARPLSWFQPRELAPERMMAIARAFEKQGRIADAKKVYEKILVKQSDFAPASQRLASIRAAEEGDDRRPSAPSVARNEPRQTTFAEKTPDAVPAQPRQTASRLVEPASSNIDGNRKRPSSGEPPPKESVAHVPRRADARRGTADPYWSVESDDVRDQPTVPDAVTISGKTLPEKQPVVSSLKPRSVSVRARLETAPNSMRQPEPATVATTVPAEIISDDADDQDEFLMPVVRSDSTVDSRFLDQRSRLPKSAEDDPKTEPRILPPAEITAQAPVSRSVRRELSRSAELRPFFGATYEHMLTMLQDRRAELESHLVTVATDESYHLQDRSLAAFLLGELGPEAIAALPRLRETMRATRTVFLQIELAQTVLLMKPEDAEAIELLLGLLLDPDDAVKWYAAFALRTSASPRTAYVVDELLETLVSENHQLRRMVFLTLGEFGPAADKAVPKLQAALKSADPKTRKVAEAVLATIVPGADRGAEASIKPDSRIR